MAEELAKKAMEQLQADLQQLNLNPQSPISARTLAAIAQDLQQHQPLWTPQTPQQQLINQQIATTNQYSSTIRQNVPTNRPSIFHTYSVARTRLLVNKLVEMIADREHLNADQASDLRFAIQADHYTLGMIARRAGLDHLTDVLEQQTQVGEIISAANGMYTALGAQAMSVVDKLDVVSRRIYDWVQARKVAKYDKGKLLSMNGVEIKVDDVAKCVKRLANNMDVHPVPYIDCTCGFYAMKMSDDQIAAEGGYPYNVILDVELGGKVIVCENGYRAEKQRILKIWCQKRLVANIRKFGTEVGEIGDLYPHLVSELP